jgi:hypothetical protein
MSSPSAPGPDQHPLPQRKRQHPRCASVAIALLLIWATRAAFAAPPDIKTLFPAGAQRGTTTEITLGGKLEAGAQVWSSRPGVTAQIGEKGDMISVTVPAETLPGLCWLRFYNAEGASALRPFVIGVLPEVREAEPNDALKAALKIETPAVVANGVLAKNGDVDTYAVTLAKGQTLIASLTANNVLGSPMDGVLQLVSPRGFVIEQNNDDHGLDPQLVHTATEEGVYCVRVFAFPAVGDASLHFSGKADFIYRLTITTGPFADHAQPLVAKRDGLARVRLAGWNLPPDLLEVQPVDAGANAEIFDTRLANSLSLPWTQLPIVVENRNGNEPQELPVPALVSACLSQPAETDVYRFQGTEKQTLTFVSEGRKLGSPIDPVLRLIGPDQQVIKRVDDSTSNVADPVLSVALPKTGEYRVEVSDLHGRGGFRFAYTLSLEQPAPDYELRVAADHFVLNSGKPLEIPVTINRKNGFAGEIDIMVTGLPEGITAAPVKSLAQGDTAKTVKLVLTAEDKAWSGPVRVQGAVANSPTLSHAASIAVLGYDIEDLWLTATPKPAQ